MLRPCTDRYIRHSPAPKELTIAGGGATEPRHEALTWEPSYLQQLLDGSLSAWKTRQSQVFEGLSETSLPLQKGPEWPEKGLHPAHVYRNGPFPDFSLDEPRMASKEPERGRQADLSQSALTCAGGARHCEPGSLKQPFLSPTRLRLPALTPCRTARETSRRDSL